MAGGTEQIRFDDQVVVISGAGRGLGRCHALLFAERGAHVVVNDVDADAAQEVVGEIAAAGGSAKAAVGSVLDSADNVVALALNSWGRIDVLINNAGVARCAPFSAREAELFEQILGVHVLGAAKLTGAAWDSLIASGGRVVNTTSAAVLGLLHHSAYAAAKGALLGFTRALALESAPLGVRVNAVMPMARTRMYELAGGVTGSEEDLMLTDLFPPEKVSPVVVYLGGRDVPLNGELLEISAGTVSRIVFAMTEPAPADSPEAVSNALCLTSIAGLTVVSDLTEVMSLKLR
jgi:NAD(P)-dependent dehydrogenase (short-subunit alcohol dehydrogenase family)